MEETNNLKNPHRFKYYEQLAHDDTCYWKWRDTNGNFRVFLKLKADSNSNGYQVEFASKGWQLDVFVRNLSLPDGGLEQVPHIYRKGSTPKRVKLCLYYNWGRQDEFKYGDALKTSIIAWTKEWLHYYELFLITGTWYGNGVEH